MLIDGYPNLELLDYKARIALREKDSEKYARVELQADVFLQNWSSTALGFGGIGGQALSDAYTTVFSDILKDVYVVFFGNRMAYMVEEPTEEFYKDLKERRLASVDRAFTRY